MEAVAAKARQMKAAGIKEGAILISPKDAENLKVPLALETRKWYTPNRSQRRAAGMRGKFIGRNGRVAWIARPAWRGPRKAVNNDDSK